MDAYSLRIFVEKFVPMEESEDVPPHNLNELGLLLFGEWFFVLLINDTLLVFA